MQTIDVKEEAHHLLEKLPENATWDDLMYKIYVRQAIEAGLEDSEAGRTIDVKDVRAKFGLRGPVSCRQRRRTLKPGVELALQTEPQESVQPRPRR